MSLLSGNYGDSECTGFYNQISRCLLRCEVPGKVLGLWDSCNTKYIQTPVNPQLKTFHQIPPQAHHSPAIRNAHSPIGIYN